MNFTRILIQMKKKRAIGSRKQLVLTKQLKVDCDCTDKLLCEGKYAMRIYQKKEKSLMDLE